MIEWKDFYYGNKKVTYFPDLVSKLCQRVGLPKKDVDRDLKMDTTFYPLKVKVVSS